MYHYLPYTGLTSAINSADEHKEQMNTIIRFPPVSLPKWSRKLVLGVGWWRDIKKSENQLCVIVILIAIVDTSGISCMVT